MRTMISGAAAFALSLAVHTVATAQGTTEQAGASTAQAPPAQTTGNKVTRTEAGKPLYTVVDGYKVDSNTMNGFRAWRAAACDRCHGANQQGLVGPSLIESLKTLTKAEFVKTLHDGRLEKGMPSWQSSKMVMDNMDNLYAYLKGRSNGDITRAHVEELKQ
ncbi:MAG TPA: c-type cytochrome [Casimicrobiaceae bacterium]|nr:c-type cytochrome [Casimicrobiaceae bacterium]